MTRKDDLDEMEAAILSAIEKARHLKLPTSAYILSMALTEVVQQQDALVPGWQNEDHPRR